MLKNFKRGLLGVVGALLVALGLFDGVYAVDNNISGVAPTTNTDGSVLDDLAQIRIYKALTNSAAECATAQYEFLVTLDFADEGQTFTYLDANQTQDGTYCYKATAVDAQGNTSEFSNIASKDVDLLAPSSPTITVS
jgi:hypothetical protein